LGETVDGHSLKLELEAEAGTVVELKVRRNAAKLSLHADGATISSATDGHGSDGLEQLTVKFPTGTGYQEQGVTLRW